MKKGRARRHREARSMKETGATPQISQLEDLDRPVTHEPCVECSGGAGRPHAAWCLAETDETED